MRPRRMMHQNVTLGACWASSLVVKVWRGLASG
jgi:hypothetical protein